MNCSPKLDIFLITLSCFFFIVSCERNVAPTELEPITTLEEAGDLLSTLAEVKLRDYSTYDFGRVRETDAKSVIVANDNAYSIAAKVSSRLSPGLICFVGTSKWLGDEKHSNKSEIVIATGEWKFDILRIARTEAPHFDFDNEAIIDELEKYHHYYGIIIRQAGTQTVSFDLVEVPENLSRFCAELHRFCPNIVDRDFGSLELLQEHVKTNQSVSLSWEQ